MKSITVGIIDYGLGNHSSVARSLENIGFRVRISDRPTHLNNVDVLMLPGVGAFPAAMQTLTECGFTDYLHEQVLLDRPLIGICLGMQLLADSSFEYGLTKGLGIIPGEIVPFADNQWHIGWSELNCNQYDSVFCQFQGKYLYFNHSFCYQGPFEHQIAFAQHGKDFPAIIRSEKVVGLQFHPEKSQLVGRAMLRTLIQELVDA